ncbi:MAG TPA: FAD-binding oxidoreductase [Sandaracinaceae bacterium LLY-WYZ-13_1]|nr:FAD-binding oxidoreductase [Sandaracinaceae bacterium LLY-WYZ-13_1]
MDRVPSHWGWGWEDRFPDRDTRALFAQQLQMLAGFPAEVDPREPVSLEEATIPEARLSAPDALADVALPSRRDRATRCYGRAYRDIVRGFHGDFAAAPDLVLRPTSEDEVRVALDWASDAGVALVPYGGGTSVVGGVEVEDREAHPGVVCLDLRAMDRVLEVDETSRAARIQAGATGPRLEAQLRARGSTLRFFPQSFEMSTLGGLLATRAGGHFATRETHIDDLVESTRMVTPAGLFESRRLPGSGAGPSPDRLVLGSEGTLGVITEAWVRIRPRPVFRASASVRFADFGDAVAATRAVSQSGLWPSNCRLLDKREALINRVATDGSHVLLLGFESADHPVEPWMERALELALDHGGTCKDGAVYRKTPPRAPEAEGDAARDGAAGRWRQAFLDAPYLVNSMVSLGILADTFETACTWDRFEALHRAIVRDVRDAMKRVCGQGMITCRFTHVYPDGPAPYFTFVAPATRGSELSQWREIKAAASDAILAHGGTITHHHVVGRMHAPWYRRQRPAPFGEVLGAIKRALDPAGVLNPGALI